MPRTKGAVDKDHAERRERILARLRARVEALTAGGLGVRAIAEAGGVSVPTMSHYFGDRNGVIAALLASYRSLGEAELAIARTPNGSFEASIRDLVTHVADGFRYGGLVALNTFGLTEGMSAPALGASYLESVLEPTVAASAARLREHMDRGEMREGEPHFAALRLLSPILVVFLHQHALNGAETYSIDLDAFLDELAATFVVAHRAPTPSI